MARVSWPAFALKIEASALANAFNQAINRVRRERAAALSCENKTTVRELPPELA
jgi:hypothetical protein